MPARWAGIQTANCRVGRLLRSRRTPDHGPPRRIRRIRPTTGPRAAILPRATSPSCPRVGGRASRPKQRGRTSTRHARALGGTGIQTETIESGGCSAAAGRRIMDPRGGSGGSALPPDPARRFSHVRPLRHARAGGHPDRNSAGAARIPFTTFNAISIALPSGAWHPTYKSAILPPRRVSCPRRPAFFFHVGRLPCSRRVHAPVDPAVRAGEPRTSRRAVCHSRAGGNPDPKECGRRPPPFQPTTLPSRLRRENWVPAFAGTTN